MLCIFSETSRKNSFCKRASQSPEERLYQPDRALPFTEKADVWKMVNMTRFIMYKYANGRDWQRNEESTGSLFMIHETTDEKSVP